MPAERGGQVFCWDCIAVSGQVQDQAQRAPAHSAGGSPKRDWLARSVFALDAWLRGRIGIIEYSSDPDCVFRIEFRQLKHAITLSDGTALLPGEEIVQLHLWTERLPPYDGAGATFDWARRFNRLFISSLQELASYLSRRDLRQVQGVRADAAFGTAEHMDQVLRFCGHYGFRPVREDAPVTLASHLHRLGENILISLLILAHNRRAFRVDCLRRSRADVFLTRSELDERFGWRGSRKQ
jgi:hypothetical protein